MDVRIRLESCSPPIGEVRAAGCATAQRFVGWLDLLRVLAMLFEEEAAAGSPSRP